MIPQREPVSKVVSDAIKKGDIYNTGIYKDTVGKYMGNAGLETVIRKLRSDKYNRVVFEMFPDAYLVGGYIRDSMIGKVSLDRDYVVNVSPLEAARVLKNKFKGTIVLFHDKGTVRIVLKNGFTLDFSKYGNSIEQDLCLRDFTVNSVGYSFRRGIIDPLKGIKDIEHGRLRTLQKENLVKDPLRCLRAHRFYSELGWKIDSSTRNSIALARGHLSRVAPERITFEFCRLLRGKHAENALKESLESGVLLQIIPNNINVIRNNIDKMVEVKRFIKNLPDKIHKKMVRKLSQDLSAIDIILLERILIGIEIELVRMKFSIVIMNRLKKADQFLSKYNKKTNAADLFEYFYQAKEMIYDLVCLAGKRKLIEIADKFLYVMEHKMISAEEIMEMTSFKGEKVGQIIHEIRRERFLGRIKTRKQTTQFVKKFMSEHHS